MYLLLGRTDHLQFHAHCKFRKAFNPSFSDDRINGTHSSGRMESTVFAGQRDRVDLDSDYSECHYFFSERKAIKDHLKGLSYNLETGSSFSAQPVLFSDHDSGLERRSVHDG